MRVLIVHGSKLGGTAGIADELAATLTEGRIEVTTRPAADMLSPQQFDAVIVGGGLYANRWYKTAKKYVKRFAAVLKPMPVWLFSSGPLDDTYLDNLPPTEQVAELMEMVDARDHVTFGGRLEEDAKGFLAGSMAKSMAGDWRDEDQIKKWAQGIAAVLVRNEAA